jgi:hypothetical protein
VSQTEKVDLVEREKHRRTMGKEMAETREQMEKDKRLREYDIIRREKAAAKLERERLKEEIAKDKAERKSRGGTLASTLSVEGGYAPSGMMASIAADLDKQERQDRQDAAAGGGGATALPPVKSAAQSPSDAVDTAVASIAKHKVSAVVLGLGKAGVVLTCSGLGAVLICCDVA